MIRRLAVPAILALAALPALAQAPSAAAPAAAPTTAERPLTALPYTPSLDTTVMDRSVDPCVDLFKFSCGKWLEKNPIPADQSRWSVYSKVGNDNLRFLWGMLEESARPNPGRDANTQKVGDYFASCMDEAAIEKAGIAPIRADLAAIDGMKTKADLARVLGELHPKGYNGSALFGFGSNQDPKNASRVIGFAAAGGLGMPSPEDYTRDDAKSKEAREHYQAYAQKIFELLGDPQPARAAATVMRLETALAKASFSPVELRDPYKTANAADRKKLQALTPSFRWDAYLGALGQAKLNDFNVTEPRFFQEVEKQLGTTSLDDLKTYLRFHVASDAAPSLSSPFVAAQFGFYGTYLQGTTQLSPRWKRCVRAVDRDLGEAMGEVFVHKVFPAQVKTDTERMLKQIHAAMEKRIQESPWMSPETKKQAIVKLHAVRDKVGYPDRWRDYSALEIRRGDFAGNVQRAAAFETRRELAKIGKPVDRGEWWMTPATVNAGYYPPMNDISFPAGVLLPPLYDPKMDAAPNYGNTGGTIGHELTHAFDDEGRQFDAKGNLKDWWTKKDAKAFQERAQCIVDQYAQYTVVDDIKINSKLTLGEDVADLGGLILGWMAWQTQMASMPARAAGAPALRDGLTPEQRFFVGYAQWACENDRPENLRVSAMTDPHSPGRYRVNGLMVNMPQFQQAFQCKAGQTMVKEQRCRVW